MRRLELTLVQANLANNQLKSQINGEQELREDRRQEHQMAFGEVLKGQGQQLDSHKEMGRAYQKQRQVADSYAKEVQGLL